MPKYRKRVLTGAVAVRVRDLVRQIAMEHEFGILSGKVARDHVQMFVSYRPNQDISTIVPWLKGISTRESCKCHEGLQWVRSEATVRGTFTTGCY